MNRRIVDLASWAHAGFRGLAIGALVTTLACAAYAASSLHSGVRPVDQLIGVGLVALALVAVFLVLAIPAGLLRLALRTLANASSERAARALRAPLPLLRFVGHPLTAVALGLALVVWASPTSGPLALYHSLWYFEGPILAGAGAGLLAGIAVHSLRSSAVPRRHAPALLSGIPAIALVVGVGGWSVFPGTGDPLVREDPAAITRIPTLELPDPSLPGPYEVATATYGSGTDLHRAEYGANATWRTATVDASAALPARDGISAAYSDWYWGYDSRSVPVNGLVWYPSEAPGRLPIVLIAHGNHDAEQYSDPGYAYLGEHLASHGLIAVSIDENYLNGDAWYDYAGAEMGTRAWLFLRHLDQFRTWDGDPSHPLAGRVDTGRVALIGHSRGGEAAAVAAMYEQDGISAPGMPAAPAGLGIKAVVAFAPSDTMYSGPGAPATLRDIDYLVMQGAHDGDLAGVDGLRTYHRVSFSGSGDHLKVALYSQRANHGRFNSVWDIGDAGLLQSWMLDRGSMLSMAEQQRLAKTAVTAFLERSLFGRTAYDAFFREPRSGRQWLPDDIVETHWQTSGRATVDDFEYAAGAGPKDTETGFSLATSVDPGLRDGLPQSDRAALLTCSGPAAMEVPLEAGVVRSLKPTDSLVFAMAAADESAIPDPLVEVRTADGRTGSVRLSDIASPRPSLPTQLWKLSGLGDRYLPQEKHAFPAEHFLQTYAVPLDRLLSRAQVDLESIASIAIRFDGPGSVYLDDIAFEPAVPGSI